MGRQAILDWMAECIPQVNLLSVSSCTQFWSVTVVPKCLNSDTLSKELCHLSCILFIIYKHTLQFSQYSFLDQPASQWPIQFRSCGQYLFIYSFTKLKTFNHHRPKADVCLAISVLPGLFEASYRQLKETAKWTQCWHDDRLWAMPLEVWSYAGLKWLLLPLNFFNLLI